MQKKQNLRKLARRNEKNRFFSHFFRLMKKIHVWPSSRKKSQKSNFGKFYKNLPKNEKLAPRRKNQKKIDFFADFCKLMQKNRIWLSKNDFSCEKQPKIKLLASSADPVGLLLAKIAIFSRPGRPFAC